MSARVATLLAIAACRGKPVVAPTPPAAPLAIWQVVVTTEPFALVGDSVLAWDADRNGIAELAVATGREVRFRTIPGLETHSAPGLWQPIPGGYLAEFEELASIRDRAGALTVMWRIGGDWYGAWRVAGDAVIGTRSATSAAVVALGLLDGAQRWRVPIPSDDRDIALDGDATTLLISRAHGDTHRVIGAIDVATGATRWSIELPYEPRQLAFGAGGFALTTPEERLALYDGATGHATMIDLHDRYPRLLVADGVAYVTDRDDNTITALRVRDGKQLWRTQHAVGFGARGVVHDRLLVLGTDHGTLVALDRATGAMQWEISTGLAGGTLYIGERWIVEVDGKRVVGFARPASQPPLELATIHGRVSHVACGTVDNLTLQIADQRVPVATDGTFRAQVRASGIVLVAGLGLFADDEPHEATAAIRLTGDGDYTTPDLELGVCPTEGP